MSLANFECRQPTPYRFGTQRAENNTFRRAYFSVRDLRPAHRGAVTQRISFQFVPTTQGETHDRDQSASHRPNHHRADSGARGSVSTADQQRESRIHCLSGSALRGDGGICAQPGPGESFGDRSRRQSSRHHERAAGPGARAQTGIRILLRVDAFSSRAGESAAEITSTPAAGAAYAVDADDGFSLHQGGSPTAHSIAKQKRASSGGRTHRILGAAAGSYSRARSSTGQSIRVLSGSAQVRVLPGTPVNEASGADPARLTRRNLGDSVSPVPEGNTSLASSHPTPAAGAAHSACKQTRAAGHLPCIQQDPALAGAHIPLRDVSPRAAASNYHKAWCRFCGFPSSRCTCALPEVAAADSNSSPVCWTDGLACDAHPVRCWTCPQRIQEGPNFSIVQDFRRVA